MDEKYLYKLLDNWEGIFKKGQLSFWLLLALKDGSKYMDEIKAFILEITDQSMTIEDQSLYRSLRRFYDLEIVDYRLEVGNKGPDRKYYYLTSLGKELLRKFIKRNIHVFYKEEVIKLISKR